MTRKRILVFCDYYLPGYKSGGGMRTIANMIDRLGDRYEFFVVTKDHDGPHDLEQYQTVKINDWNTIGRATVLYLSKDNITFSQYLKVIRKIEPDAIYLNSIFGTSTRIALLMRKLRYFQQSIVLAPEGELSVGAISNKIAKKRSYLRLFRLLGLYKNIIWKVCSELEEREVLELGDKSDERFIAPNMSPTMLLPNFAHEFKPHKQSGEVKIVFLSRFARKKNFKWFLERLTQTEGNIIVDVIGPIEDEQYWQECLVCIEDLPENILVRHIGSIPYEQALEKIVEYHFFLLPTLGENFGHVFIEGLAAGCPLIASDRTPWLNLEQKNIGWDIPLENPELWLKIIKRVVEMNFDEYSFLSKNAREYAVNWLSDHKLEEATDAVLKFAVSEKHI